MKNMLKLIKSLEGYVENDHYIRGLDVASGSRPFTAYSASYNYDVKHPNRQTDI